MILHKIESLKGCGSPDCSDRVQSDAQATESLVL